MARNRSLQRAKQRPETPTLPGVTITLGGQAAPLLQPSAPPPKEPAPSDA